MIMFSLHALQNGMSADSRETLSSASRSSETSLVCAASARSLAESAVWSSLRLRRSSSCASACRRIASSASS
jgi:hypothetical protein